MGLWTPRGLAGYGATFSSTGATRIVSAWGTTITPGNNTMGTYAQVLSAANVSFDAFGVMINFNSNAVATAARDTICDIGIDPAGGTAYNILLPQLLASCAGVAIGSNGGTGINYFFPVFIKAGSTVACRASVNNATVGTLICRMRILGAPRDARNMVVGSRVVAVGVTAGSSAGTAVTSGQGSDGTWTSLGTIAAGDNPWFWQYGVGINNATMSSTQYTADLAIGDASTKPIVCEDRVWFGGTNETWTDSGPDPFGAFQAAAGAICYGRIQASGTPNSGLSMAAYGVV